MAGSHFLDFHLSGHTRHGLFWGWRLPLGTVILRFIRALSCTDGPVPFIAEERPLYDTPHLPFHPSLGPQKAARTTTPSCQESLPLYTQQEECSSACNEEQEEENLQKEETTPFFSKSAPQK